jgi:hypothetical protein
MQTSSATLEMAVDMRAKARHWRFSHYDASRWYTLIDSLLGVPSVALATVILGFAFYAVDRPNAPLWAQYALALLAVLQAVMATLQLYVRPGALAESHRVSAIGFGTVGRRWASVENRLRNGQAVPQEELDDIFTLSDRVARESRPIPRHITARVGARPAPGKLLPD